MSSITLNKELTARIRASMACGAVFDTTDYCVTSALIAIFGADQIMLSNKYDRVLFDDFLLELKELAFRTNTTISVPTSCADFIASLENPNCRGAIIIRESIFSDEVLHYSAIIPTQTTGVEDGRFLHIDIPRPTRHTILGMSEVKLADLYGETLFMGVEKAQRRTIFLIHEHGEQDNAW